MEGRTATQAIADFVCSTEFDDFPSSASEAAKRSFLDCVGVLLAGTADENTRIVREYIRETGGTGESTILGTGEKVPAASAALVNGVASHVLDFDDVSPVMFGHPSAISCPTSLAVGELLSSNGKDVLTAYILGGEVACKMGAALTYSQYKRGWHNTGTMGTFGATTVAGKLLGLGKDKMTHALGLAASMAAGVKKNFGTSTKSFHVGQACSNGIRAAILAEKGFTSSPEVIEGEFGLANLLSGEFKRAELTERLGNPYSVDEPGYVTKLYPSCAFTHSAIDAALELKKERGLSSEKISKIECGASQGAVDTAPYRIPRKALEAKFSMPYCLSLAFNAGSVSLSSFTDQQCNDRQMLRLMEKVRFYVQPEFASRGYSYKGVRLEVSLNDGTILTKEVGGPKGGLDHRLSDTEFIEKYRANASLVLRGHVEESANAILKMEKLKAIDDLTGMLVAR